MQETQETPVQSLGGMILWKGKWQPTAVFLPGKFHGQRSLTGYSPWGHRESDMTELTRMHVLHLSMFLFQTSLWIKWM